MDEDGMSKLPEPIFHHVLSFLSNKKAVQTCVVSKPCRHLVSIRPNFSLLERDFKGDKEKFRSVLGKSLQVYFDQKLSIEDFSVSCESTDDPKLVSLLEEWIPKVVRDLGAKKFHLKGNWVNLVKLPFVVFESESLEEINLESCKLSQIINIVGNNQNHLKTLHLRNVYIEEEESFAKFLSNCSLIEDLSLRHCKGLKTINMHNLKSFQLDIRKDDDFFLPSIVGRLGHKYFPRLTCLRLTKVHLSSQWFNSFSCFFPCLEELGLSNCFGFDELKLSSRSIKNLDIWLDQNTNKATIDAPSIETIFYKADISQSISFTATTSSCAWNSQLHLSLDQLDASLWFPKISEHIAAFGRSQINSLVLCHFGSGNNQNDISVCYGGSCKMPVAIESLTLVSDGRYYDSFFSDLLSGLFRIVRPREMNQNWFVNAKQEHKLNQVCVFLCRTFQRDEEDGVRSFFWQQDLEQVSLQVHSGVFYEECQGITTSWLEYVAALLPQKENTCLFGLRFRLKWRDGLIC